jgi:hypothetical protein
MILGLAASNRTAENILFSARHTLSVCKSLFSRLYNNGKPSNDTIGTGGGVLHDELERESTVSLLLGMEKRTGWRAAELIHSLKEQWDEDADID